MPISKSLYHSSSRILLSGRPEYLQENRTKVLKMDNAAARMINTILLAKLQKPNHWPL